MKTEQNRHRGREALTPPHQGNANIEEIKEEMGDKILSDRIPAILFMPTYTQEELDYIRRM